MNDHTEEGNYIDGEKHGVWVHTYDNGQLNFKGEFAGGTFAMELAAAFGCRCRD